MYALAVPRPAVRDQSSKHTFQRQARGTCVARPATRLAPVLEGRGPLPKYLVGREGAVLMTVVPMLIVSNACMRGPRRVRRNSGYDP